MKTFLTALICFIMEVSSILGFSSAPTDPTTVTKTYNDDKMVSVIVELDEKDLLNGITTAKQRAKLLENYENSEAYKKIKEIQATVKKSIIDAFSLADFTDSYTYSFVLDGFSLEIPYKYVDDLEKIPGVKSVSISAEYSQIEDEAQQGDEEMLNSVAPFTYADELHELGYTGKGTVVAILDSGFQLTHEALNFDVENPKLSKADIETITTFKVLNTIVPMWGAHYYSSKIPYVWDYADIDKNVVNPNSGHGTHVAGIVGGKSDRITGVAPDAQLLLMKVFGDEEGSLAKEYVNLAALDDAVKLGADVVNMSLGSPSGQDPDNIFTQAVINKLERSGISVVCSAGNEASMGENDATYGSNTINTDLIDYGTISSPASYGWSMAIASAGVDTSKKNVDSNGIISVKGEGVIEMASYSSWGVTADMKLKPEITTPGSSILSCVPGDDDSQYEYYSGTSMASPYYAGSYALMKEYLSNEYPKLAKTDIADLINNILMSTATVFREYGSLTYYSPRQQGAGFINLENALKTSAYLTTADGTSRPKLELGEDTDGTLEMSFMVHNMSDKSITYDISTQPLAESYTKRAGVYVNTLTSRKLYENSNYTVEYTDGVTDKTVTVEPNSTKKVSMKITFDESFLASQQTAFKNGFFLEGFIFLKDSNASESAEPTLSLPFMAFDGDWQLPQLFDNTMYDSEPSYLGREWGLMVTDGKSYYPMGANIFEIYNEYGIDTKLCAYSENAMSSKLKDPYVSVAYGLIRNGKRVEYSLFTSGGIFRYMGTSLFEYMRKTNSFSKSNVGFLWGGDGLIDGNEYVYKVSTKAANYDSGKVTKSFPFVVDNDAAYIKDYTYNVVDGDGILNITLKDNRYIMGFEIFDESDASLDYVSFKDVEPDADGCYSYTMNISDAAHGAVPEKLKVYIVDYAYNETMSEIALNSDSIGSTTISAESLRSGKYYNFPEPYTHLFSETVATEEASTQSTTIKEAWEKFKKAVSAI